MPKRWADGLMLGTFYLPNGQVWSCNERDRDYFFHRAKETIADGVPLPVCLEHQPTVGMSAHQNLEEKTARTVGHCHDVRIATPDVDPENGNGQIQWLVECDDDDFTIIRKNGCFSPEIRPDVINTMTGKKYPGQTIVHLASTPRPVQVTGRPHISLSNQPAVNLRNATVGVSLSLAEKFEPLVSLSAKGKDMPFPPKKKDDDAPKDDDKDGVDDNTGLDLDKPADTAAPPAVTPPVDAAAGGMNEDAHIIQQLSEIAKEDGIVVHVSPGMTLQEYCRHLCTAHKSKQAAGANDADDDNLNKQDPNDQDQNYGGGANEVSESAPIQMSQTQPTPREIKMAEQVISGQMKTLKARIAVAYERGFLDDKMREEWSKETTVKLSMADFNADGELRPLNVGIMLDGIERQMKAGGKGPFAKSGKVAAQAPAYDPSKPISSTRDVQLSAGKASDEIATGPPDDGDAEEKADMNGKIEAGNDLAGRVMVAKA